MGNSQRDHQYLSLKSSIEKVKHGIDSYWYVRDSLLFHLIDIDIDRPPLHRFLVDYLDLSKGEINKGKYKICGAYLWSTWFEPKVLLSPKL
jgi:hypothetical protein